MKNVLSSQIELTIDYNNILNDFKIVQFTTSENYISYGALFLDQFITGLKAQSVLFEKGRSLYALFIKTEFDKINFPKELGNLDGGDALTYKVIDTSSEITKIPSYLVAQLLINTLTTPKNELLKFNNLTGGLYVFNNSMIETTKTRNDERLVKKIKAIEFRINKDLSLNFGVRTFSSLLLRESIDIIADKLVKEAKYTFSYATKSMRRILPSEEPQFKAASIFIKRSSGKKSIIPFFAFDNLEDFNESKVGILYEIFDAVKVKLNKYIEIGFKENTIIQTHRAKRNKNATVFSTIDGQKHFLNIINHTDEDDFTFQIDQLIETISSVALNLSIKRSQTHDSEMLNIRCIHNKEYYKKYNLEDAYSSSNSNVQHLTVEDFNFKSEPSIKAVLKEIAIKNDIANERISIVEWSKYKFTNDWTFGIKNEDGNYFFLSIYPNGNLNFTREDNPLLSPLELRRLMNIYDSYNNVDGIVLDPDGNINIILKTNLFTIPDIDFIHAQLKSASTNDKVKISQVITCLNKLAEDSDEYDPYIATFKNWEEADISKSDILRIVSHRTHKKKLNDLLYEQTGVLLKTYFRDISRYEIMDSNLDIHSYFENGVMHYYVGTIGSGIRTTIPKASVVRKIIGIDDSPLFFEQLIPLMNVDFVRYGDLTVIPFPFKYLREWISLQRKL